MPNITALLCAVLLLAIGVLGHEWSVAVLALALTLSELRHLLEVR
jgi:hypothetical protein